MGAHLTYKHPARY